MSPVLDVAVPVVDDGHSPASAVRRLHRFLHEELPFTSAITIADCAGSDGTWITVMALAAELPDVRALRLNEPGRGRALAAAWLTSDARVLAHIDAESESELSMLPQLVAPVISGNSDLSLGGGTQMARPSLPHNLFVRIAFGSALEEVHTRPKAIRADVARRLLPRVRNRNWLFDAELVAEASRAGFRIHELERAARPSPAPAA